MYEGGSSSQTFYKIKLFWLQEPEGLELIWTKNH